MKQFFQKLKIASVRAYLNGLALISKEKAGEEAFQIFCTPRKGRPHSKDLEFLQTADQQITLNAEGHAVHSYHWQGTGPTVLLVHGWESNAARWQRTIKHLRKKGYSVVALDAPGHGQSGSKYFNVPLYAEFLKAAVQHFEPQSVVAHSIGGFAAVYLLRHHDLPSVQRLAILGTPAKLTKMLETYQTIVGLSEGVMEGLQLFFIKRYGKSYQYFNLADFVQDLSHQGLIIHDEHDAVVAYDDAIEISAKWPSAHFITTQKLGHSLNGSEVRVMIADFLAKNAL